METIMNATSGDGRHEGLSPRLIGTIFREWNELARLALQPVGPRRLTAREQLGRMALQPDHDRTGHKEFARFCHTEVLSCWF